MTDTFDELGRVDLIVVDSPGSKLIGEIAPALQDLRAARPDLRLHIRPSRRWPPHAVSGDGLDMRFRPSGSGQ
jgi:DNA-binding transcriptional LysR family regulator